MGELSDIVKREAVRTVANEAYHLIRRFVGRQYTYTAHRKVVAELMRRFSSEQEGVLQDYGRGQQHSGPFK